MSACLRLTDDNFLEEVLDAEVPVLVDFWGSWCPPCKMMEPVVDALAETFAGVLKVGKLNVDRNPATRSQFEVSAAPTFILFQDGEVSMRAIGARSHKQLVELINRALGRREAAPQRVVAVHTASQASGRTQLEVSTI
ncbi:MAG: thioredoxin [Phycisphaerae bacterium]|nr:thioredoxin [Phycisphaerae bacterium]